MLGRPSYQVEEKSGERGSRPIRDKAYFSRFEKEAVQGGLSF